MVVLLVGMGVEDRSKDCRWLFGVRFGFYCNLVFVRKFFNFFIVLVFLFEKEDNDSIDFLRIDDNEIVYVKIL